MEFRTIANRLINCNYQTGMDLLKKFLAYIDNNELISDYIQGYVNPTDFEPVERETCFSSMGDTKQEEISFTYQYLKYGLETYSSYYRDIAFGYAKEANDAVKEFNTRIVLPLVNYIEGYLTEIGILMGYDEDVKYTINVSGGTAQVNLATDSSIINSVQNNGVDAAQLEKLLINVLQSVPTDVSSQDKEQVEESIEVIREELQRYQPKKSFIRTAITGLQAVKGSAEFLAAVTALYQFVQPYIG